MATIKEEQNPVSSEILAFLGEYSYTLSTEHKLSDPWFLRTLLDVTFFSPLHTRLINALDTEDFRQADQRLELAIPLLRKMSPRELNLSTKYLPEKIDIDNLPFETARWDLSDISFLLVRHSPPFSLTKSFRQPLKMLLSLLFLLKTNKQQSPAEMMLCLGSVVNEICFETERLTLNRASGLATDDLLPILVFVIIHTDIWRANLLLKFLQVYCDESFQRGRLGFCLTNFEAALSDISNNLAIRVLNNNN